MEPTSSSRVAALVAGRVPFVQATVVRAQCPTSARPGDSAVVLGDGAIEGFVGGQCAEGSVRAAALSVLATGEALLLRILPEGEAPPPEARGAATVVNPCLSGGALEVFLEPRLPAPLLGLVGGSPIAEAVARLGEPLGFAVARAQPGDTVPAGAIAVVVATHGRDEEGTIRRALGAGIGFVGLVASASRGAAVLDAMELDPAERARVRTPVGLDIGARTAEEIALSIMAEVVRAIRVDGLTPPDLSSDAPPVEVRDPVCGMTVVVGPDTPHAVVEGAEHWYCGTGCRDHHVATVPVS
ncbi:XdhC family protein [Iamia sp. SCSIO 61187]|uniref:XdhC family protein n=1 Tax=Iamia sp. SCSIO 61187 TaxID=2722752 RepID=UPI001C626827|nr:XdhC family protein [Iamia sp. SCSIO 61187]QYG94688.1 XdhC family protein [Iamia sp. SCSIO 61187]